MYNQFYYNNRREEKKSPSLKQNFVVNIWVILFNI